MGRGFISGAVWGLIVSGCALGLASLLGEQPPGRTPPAPPQVEAPGAAGETAPTGSGAAQVAGSRPVAAPDTATPDAPEPPAGPASGDTAPAAAETAPPDAPVTAEVDGALPAPDPADDAGEVAAGSDTPVLPAPQAQPPAAPEAETALSVATEPAQPPAPPAPAAETAFDADSGDAVADGPEAADPATEETAAQPADGADSAGPEAAEAADVAPVETAPVDSTATPPGAEIVVGAAPDAAGAPAPDAEPEPAAEAGDEAALVTTEADTAENPMPGGDAGVVVRRAGEAVADDAATEPATDATTEADGSGADVVAVEPVPDDAPALVRFGAGYDPADGRPTMAVVLIDDGRIAGAATALTDLPFPVSIALDPARPGAAETAAAYRAAGFEVLALADLPAGAAPRDAEIVLEGAFTVMPEAVGLIDAGAGGLASGDLTEQVMENLGAAGRGFVTVSRGLNTALRSAEQAGVPAATIYRDLDAEGQEARVIRRFLDQAAFRARQESGVVMLGRLRPETISALVLWGTANRAGQVALVPVSAVLRGDG